MTAKKPDLSELLRMDALAFKKGPTCKVRVIAETMTTPEQTMFIASLRDPMITGAQLARALAKLDPRYKMSADSINRHRNSECACT